MPQAGGATRVARVRSEVRYMSILAPNQSEAPLYQRSPLQISVLLIASLGFYYFYWAYKVRRFTEVTLELPNQSLWKTIAVVVPILNLFMLADLSRRVDGVAFRASLPPVYTFGWCFLAAVIGFMYKLPDPYWLVCLFTFVPIAIVHYHVMRAQIAISGRPALPRPLTWFEWLILWLGGVLQALIFWGAADAAPKQNHPAWFVPAAALAMLIALYFIHRKSCALAAPGHELIEAI